MREKLIEHKVGGELDLQKQLAFEIQIEGILAPSAVGDINQGKFILMHSFLVSYDDVLVLCAQSTVLPELEHAGVFHLALPLGSLLFYQQRFHQEIEDDGKSGSIERVKFLGFLLLGEGELNWFEIALVDFVGDVEQLPAQVVGDLMLPDLELWVEPVKLL